MTSVEADSAGGGARAESTPDEIVVGPAAAAVRRAVGPVAWCALEYLAASPRGGHDDRDTVAASVRSLATGLGVSKNTVNRAVSVLRAAGLVEPVQTRSDTGRFAAGRYRLVVAPSVVERVESGCRGVRAGRLAFQRAVGAGSRSGVPFAGACLAPSSCRCCRGSEVVALVDRLGSLVDFCRQVPVWAIGCRV